MARNRTHHPQDSKKGQHRAGGFRPVWKGSINFGLVNIPVSMHTAEEHRDGLNFKLLDRHGLTPIHYQRVNEKTGKEVPWNQIVKGYEYQKGKYVPVTDKDFQSANVEATETIQIMDFIEAEKISPIYFDKPYYLEPLKKARKSYALLREVMQRTGKIGISKIVIRSREHLAALISNGPMLILNLLRYPYELRSTDAYDIPGENLKELQIEEKEIKMAERLVEAMVGEWDPKKYHDDYREDLMKLIEKKIKAGPTHVIEEAQEVKEPKRQAKVVNIMDLLKRSVEKTEKEENRSGRDWKRRKAG
jgi:DNA end-binding protein Ku